MEYPSPTASAANKTEKMSRKNPYHHDWAKAIVSIVSQYPIIYDKRHSDYKHRSKKMAVWKEISDYVCRQLQVNMTASELEKRWLGWKSTFISEHRRLHTPPVDTNVKKWYLFKEMKFMEPYISHHRKSFKAEDSYEADDLKPKTEYFEHLMRPLPSRMTRSSTSNLHDLSHSFPSGMDPCYLSQTEIGKSELADSTSTLAISHVVGNYSDHGMKLAMQASQSSVENLDPIDRKPVCPDSSGLPTRSPAINPFFKEEQRDRCKCIIEERLELVPLERRTMCLIEIFQVIHKYEGLP